MTMDERREERKIPFVELLGKTSASLLANPIMSSIALWRPLFQVGPSIMSRFVILHGDHTCMTTTSTTTTTYSPRKRKKTEWEKCIRLLYHTANIPITCRHITRKQEIAISSMLYHYGQTWASTCLHWDSMETNGLFPINITAQIQ